MFCLQGTGSSHIVSHSDDDMHTIDNAANDMHCDDMHNDHNGCNGVDGDLGSEEIDMVDEETN